MKRAFGHGAWKWAAAGWIGYGVLDLVAPTGATEELQLVCLAGATVAMFSDIWHENRPCDTCRASAPVDGPWQAHQSRPTLRLFHLLSGWRCLLPMLAGSVLFVILAPDSWVRWSTLLAGLYFATNTVLGRFHREVREWCPRCRQNGGGGGGGHDDLVDGPSPVAPQAR